ncbi:MAG: FtsX-like permease family protein, partial [Clostridia bacterium]|nr:FtsX-like permease family protein [Clostridia bacterium]
MKATGMKNGTIIGQHVLRFVFVAVIAVLLAWILALPMTHLCIDPGFKMMGMALAVDYNINPLEMFIIFPAMILVSTTLSATLTALTTKKIKSVDTANIE